MGIPFPQALAHRSSRQAEQDDQRRDDRVVPPDAVRLRRGPWGDHERGSQMTSKKRIERPTSASAIAAAVTIRAPTRCWT